VSPKDANLFVCFAISAILELLEVMSAIEDSSFSRTAAASIFLPALNAFAVFFNKI
jgi:hypothetical protein